VTLKALLLKYESINHGYCAINMKTITNSNFLGEFVITTWKL